MFNDYFSWDTPWELYFHALIFIPIVQRLIFLGEPALKAIQIHGHHLKWLFERLKEIPKGYSIAAKFTVGLLVPATIALMRFVIFEPEAMYSSWEIRGEVEEVIDDDTANHHIDKLSNRYTGHPYNRQHNQSWKESQIKDREMWLIKTNKLISMVRPQAKSEPE